MLMRYSNESSDPSYKWTQKMMPLPRVVKAKWRVQATRVWAIAATGVSTVDIYRKLSIVTIVTYQ